MSKTISGGCSVKDFIIFYITYSSFGLAWFACFGSQYLSLCGPLGNPGTVALLGQGQGCVRRIQRHHSIALGFQDEAMQPN